MQGLEYESTQPATSRIVRVSNETKEGQAPISDKLYDDTVITFEEDRVVVNAQYKRMLESANPQWVDLGIDAGSIQARRRILSGIEREKVLVADRQS